MLRIIDLLQHPSLAKADIVSGSVQQLMRSVHHICVIDDIDDIQDCAGTVIITATIFEQRDQMIMLTHAAARAGAVAIGMQFPADCLPVVRSAATQAQLPVIALPGEVSITLLETQLREQLQHTSTATTPNAHVWLHYALKVFDLPTFVSTLAAEWERAVVVVDQAGQMLAHAGTTSADLVACLRRWQTFHPGDSLPCLIPEAHVFGTPLLGGSCLMQQYEGDMPSQSERQMVADAMLALEMVVQQHVALQRRNARQRAEFIWDLTQGRIQDELTALVRGNQVGFDLRIPYCVVAGQIESTVSDGITQQVLQIVSQLADERHIAQIGTVAPHQLVLMANETESDHDIDDWLEASNYALDHVDCRVTWGVSESNNGLAAAQAMYQYALTACQLGRIVKGTGSLNKTTHLGVYPLLHKLCDDPDSRRFWERYLQGLLQVEHHKSSELLHTLEVYLALQGNVSEAARQLDLHRQSMNYRLQRITELTGCNLSDPLDRFALELSLHLYRLQTLKKPEIKEGTFALS